MCCPASKPTRQLPSRLYWAGEEVSQQQPSAISDDGRMAMAEILDRPLYLVGEAARLLGVHPTTLRRWLDGHERKGDFYAPVIRPERTGSDIVTWAEFIEAGLLAEYRHERKVSMQHIRPVIEALREKYKVPYPLAHYRPWVADKELVVAIQEGQDIESGERLIVLRRNQYVLAGPAETWLRKVEFAEDIARRYRPAGPESPVVIDPEQSFGAPTIRGVRTEVIYEMFDAGDSIDMIASGYELGRDQIEAAIRFESPRPKSPEPQPAAA
jgi:uncharacterized protein (DUF433 family)